MKGSEAEQVVKGCPVRCSVQSGCGSPGSGLSPFTTGAAVDEQIDRVCVCTDNSMKCHLSPRTECNVITGKCAHHLLTQP